MRLVNVSIVPMPEADYCKRSSALEVNRRCSLTLEHCCVSGGSFVFPSASLTATDTQFTKSQTAAVLADSSSVGVTLTRCLVSGASSGHDHFQDGFLAGECGAIEVRDEWLEGVIPAVRVALSECIFEGNYGCAVAYRLYPTRKSPNHAAFRQAFDLKDNQYRRNRIAFSDSAVDEEGRDLPEEYRGVVSNSDNPQGTNRSSLLFEPDRED